MDLIDEDTDFLGVSGALMPCCVVISWGGKNTENMELSTEICGLSIETS